MPYTEDLQGNTRSFASRRYLQNAYHGARARHELSVLLVRFALRTNLRTPRVLRAGCCSPWGTLEVLIVGGSCRTPITKRRRGMGCMVYSSGLRVAQTCAPHALKRAGCCSPWRYHKGTTIRFGWLFLCGTSMGNRTPDSAVRGRRLDRLTMEAYRFCLISISHGTGLGKRFF